MLTNENGLCFKYESIGKFVSNGSWIHPDRVIDTNELILVTRGVVYICEENERYELHENDCLILESGKRHYGYLSSEDECSFYWFHFKTNIPMPFKYLKGGELYDVKFLLKKLIHMSKLPMLDQSELDAAAMLLYYELNHVNSNDRESSLASKLAEYIRINISNGVSAASAAAHFGYNTDYVGKLFKKSFGVGIKQYIVSCKTGLAKDLLSNTDLNVKEIAARLGFPDSNAFTEFFIYHEEIAPTGFRNKYFGTHMNNR